MNKKKIKINDKEVEIKPVELGILLDALDIVERLPETIKKLDLEDEQNTVKVAVKLISESREDMFQLISMLSGLGEDEIAKLTIREVIQLAKALLEVNEVTEIKKDWGGITEMFQKEKVE